MKTNKRHENVTKDGFQPIIGQQLASGVVYDRVVLFRKRSILSTSSLNYSEGNALGSREL